MQRRRLRPVARCLVILLLAACTDTVVARPQQVDTAPAQSPSQTSDSATPGPDAHPSPAQTPSGNTGSTAPQQQPTAPQEPVGTAAAPYEKVTGVPASRPAGAAIAPAKQKRSRSILIKVGLIAAAGVAIGTVVALSAASSSKPH